MASNSFILPSNVHRTPVSLTVLWNVYGDCDNYATLKGHSGAVMELHYNTDGRWVFRIVDDNCFLYWFFLVSFHISPLNFLLGDCAIKNYCILDNHFIILSVSPQVRCLLFNMKVTQSHLTVCDHMGYTVHGILQARILEWIAVPFSRGSSQPNDRTQVSHITDGFFTVWATREGHCSMYTFIISI